MINEVNAIYKKEKEGRDISENSDEIETSSILELTMQLKNHIAKKLRNRRRRKSSIAPPIEAFEREMKTEAGFWKFEFFKLMYKFQKTQLITLEAQDANQWDRQSKVLTTHWCIQDVKV